MADSISIWMPVYIGDYMRDTSHLDAAEHGAYMLLLMHAWVNNGALPSKPESLRKISRMDRDQWAESSETLLGFFYLGDGKYRSGRVDKELERAQRNRDQKRVAGKASAEAKKKRKTNSRSTGVGTPVSTNVVTHVPTGVPTHVPTDVITADPTASQWEVNGESTLHLHLHLKDKNPSSSSCEAFAMHEHWGPTKSLVGRLIVAGVSEKLANQKNIGEFVSYWMGRSSMERTNGDWEHSLVMALDRRQEYESSRPAARNHSGRASAAVAVSGSQDISWLSESDE